MRDVGGRAPYRPRALALAVGHLAVLALALLIDPPASGRLAHEVDRLSLVYVELAAGMLVVPLIAAPLRAGGSLAVAGVRSSPARSSPRR